MRTCCCPLSFIGACQGQYFFLILKVETEKFNRFLILHLEMLIMGSNHSDLKIYEFSLMSVLEHFSNLCSESLKRSDDVWKSDRFAEEIIDTGPLAQMMKSDHTNPSSGLIIVSAAPRPLPLSIYFALVSVSPRSFVS